MVVDPPGERGGDGDDHALGPHLEAAGVDRRRGRPSGRCLRPGCSARPGCRASRAIFSGSPCVPPTKRHICAPSRVLKLRSKVPGVGLVARGGDVEEGEEQRELARLGAEDRAGSRAGSSLRNSGLRCCRRSRWPASARPTRRRSGLPGGVDRHLGRHLVEAEDRVGSRSGRIAGSGRRRPERPRVAVGAALALGVDVDVVAVVEGRELADPELLGEREDVVLGRADEGGAALGDLAAADRAVERPAADPVSGLEHDHRAPRLVEPQRGGEAGEAGAHDDHVGASRSGPAANAPGTRFSIAPSPAAADVPSRRRRVIVWSVIPFPPTGSLLIPEGSGAPVPGPPAPRLPTASGSRGPSCRCSGRSPGWRSAPTPCSDSAAG